MKKALLFFVFLILTGCGLVSSRGPESVAQEFLEGLRDRDGARMESLSTGQLQLDIRRREDQLEGSVRKSIPRIVEWKFVSKESGSGVLGNDFGTDPWLLGLELENPSLIQQLENIDWGQLRVDQLNAALADTLGLFDGPFEWVTLNTLVTGISGRGTSQQFYYKCTVVKRPSDKQWKVFSLVRQ